MKHRGRHGARFGRPVKLDHFISHVLEFFPNPLASIVGWFLIGLRDDSIFSASNAHRPSASVLLGQTDAKLRDQFGGGRYPVQGWVGRHISYLRYFRLR